MSSRRSTATASAADHDDRRETVVGVRPGTVPRDENLALEVIEGIDASTADKLRRAGLQDVVELADFKSPEQLHQYLAARRARISLDRIRNVGGRGGDWVAQARRLHSRTWVVDFGADRSVEPTRWSTTVSSEELGMERTFEGIAPQAWSSWIMEQSRLGAAHAQEAASEPRRAVETPSSGDTGDAGASDRETRLAVTSLIVLDRDDSPTTSDGLDVSVQVQLSGTRAAAVAKSATPFVVDVIAIPQTGGEPMRLATSLQQFARNQLAYELTIQVPIPPVGEYQLWAQGACFVPGVHVAPSRPGPELTVIERTSDRRG